MKKEELSLEKQLQYDKICAEMREELGKLPKVDGSTLCNSNNVKRREITERYLPKLKQLFDKYYGEEMSFEFLDSGLPVETGKETEAVESMKKFRKYCDELGKKPSELTEKELNLFREKV